jgi:signal transduction histidine kinase
MNPEEVDRLLQAFEQESEGIGREYEGSGLSLTVARTLVDRMEGNLTVDTEKGDGSRFVIRLPQAGEEAPARS